MNSLIRIKEFKTGNITQEQAAELCALVGLNRLWKSKDIVEQGFEIEDCWYGKGERGTMSFSSSWKNPNYNVEGFVRVHDGVIIKINNKVSLRIMSDGRAIMYTRYEKGDIKAYYSGNSLRGIPPSTEYFENDETFHEYPCSAIQLVELYIKFGFYTIINKIEEK